MAIYDLGTASLAANGEVTGVGTTWKAPLTLIRVGATIVFKTEPVKIYTISEIISDTQINVYNPNSETVPAGTGYAILAHDGITVQGLAQDVAETLRYYQSRETEVADAVDAFNNFDASDFNTKVTQVNTQYGSVVSIGAQVSSDAEQVASDKESAEASAASASADKAAAALSAQEAADYANQANPDLLVSKIELSSTSGASLVGFGDSATVADLQGLGLTEGDALLPVIQPYPGAVQSTVHNKMVEIKSVLDWGAIDGVESSAAAQAMVDDTGTLIVPVGFNLVAKNINLSSASEVYIYGKMTLPSNCDDFDRALYADGNKAGIKIFINEIDGNRGGQSGNIGTHLLYMTNCEYVNAYVKYAHDNYFSRSYTPVSAPDGKRQESAGCLFFYQCHNSQCIVDRIEHWGREGVFAYDSNRFVMALGHAQGRTDIVGDEYSGFQLSGAYNRLLYASVDNSQASGGSFDCVRSWAGPIIVSNNKYFGSIGMGHPGFPATDSVIESITSINSAGNGIQFVGNSTGNRVLSATIISPAAAGVSQSDGANNNKIDNFKIKDPGTAHVVAFNSTLHLTNGDITENANSVPKLNATGTANFTVRNVRMDSTKQLQLTFFAGLAGNSTATITDGNINPWSSIILQPSNANGALANAYVQSVSNGSCVISTASGTAAGSGAGFRYMVV